MGMKKIIRTDKTFTLMIKPVFFAALLLVGCCPAKVLVDYTTVPGGLSDYGKDAVVYQHSAAENHYMFRQCFRLAEIRLTANLTERKQRPVAVVVDVDETVLDNSRYQLERIAEGETFTPDSWNAWVERREAPALPGALDFLTFAKEQGCTIFYVTNRAANEELATIDNLNALGFPDADTAHVFTRQSTSDKTKRRYQVRRTHDVLLYVGDQLTDFKQLYKDRTDNYGKNTVEANLEELEQYFVLTPNTMYGTWKDVVTGKGTSEERKKFMDAYYQEFLPKK